MAQEVACRAALTPGAELVPHTIVRRACSANDVAIDIKFAGICHSDIHQAREEWGPGIFPMVPGHEIGGVVTAVGSDVTKFKVGDVVGVGCMVDSCRKCVNCRHGDEQYCKGGMVGTYNSKHKYSHHPEHNEEGGSPTYGGYSKAITVDENYVLSIPTNLDLAAATPLLCAGITMFSPMKYYNLRPSDNFAVVGMGGLGHMGVKLAVAFGCRVTVISRGTSKREDSLRMGAHHFLNSKNAEEMAAAAGSFDFIISTVSAQFDINDYLGLLTTNGKFINVGAPPKPVPLGVFAIIGGRKTVAGSLIGGIEETQEMLDFCGRHDIVCDIEMIDADKINEAYERTVNADVKYRFVIDTATI